MITATTVFSQAAGLLNDQEQTVYNSTTQMPYLNMALRELEEIFANNNLPITAAVSDTITVTTGTTTVSRSDGVSTTGSFYPMRLMEIQQIWERPSGDSEIFIPMNRREFLPHWLEGEPVTSFQIWALNGEDIKVPESSQDNILKLDYLTSIFVEVTTAAQTINIPNVNTFLIYRTASLSAFYIGENKDRAAVLNIDAQAGLDRALGISVKGQQAYSSRRRPFRAAWKSRGIW